MKWICCRLYTTMEAEEFITSMLMNYGITSVQIEDRIEFTEKEKSFGEVPPDPIDKRKSDQAVLVFYLEKTENYQQTLEEIKNNIRDLADVIKIGQGKLEVSMLKDVDWNNKWKENFHQFSIDDILILPTWEEASPADKDKMTIRIDPGIAFGTGLHETTQLCIQQIRKNMKPRCRVMDLGCGSGILGIAAIKMGAGYVCGIDLDTCAVSAAMENMRQNKIPEQLYSLVVGDLAKDAKIQEMAGFEACDIIVANILAETLSEMAAVIVKFLKPGGIFIGGGILKGKEEMVKEAYVNVGLHIKEVNVKGEWAAVTAEK